MIFTELDERAHYRAAVIGLAEDDIVEGPSVLTDTIEAAREWMASALPAFCRQFPDVAPEGDVAPIEVALQTEGGASYLDWEYTEDTRFYAVVDGTAIRWEEG